jgi:cytidylate kinase
VTRRPIVAIDGPAGSGKSTLGRGLAAALDLPYVNTGQMYRAVTARALALGVDLDDGEALGAIAGELRFDLDAEVVPPELWIDGQRPADDLLTPEVEAAVSPVARHPQVREVLAREQRRLGSEGGVIEGRDIGTVVFPDADVKLFLDVNPLVRASRRTAEREAEDHETAEALALRDALDARTNPLEPAGDAIVLDNEGRSPNEVLAEALAVVRSRLEA